MHAGALAWELPPHVEGNQTSFISTSYVDTDSHKVTQIVIQNRNSTVLVIEGMC